VTRSSTSYALSDTLAVDDFAAVQLATASRRMLFPESPTNQGTTGLCVRTPHLLIVLRLCSAALRSGKFADQIPANCLAIMRARENAAVMQHLGGECFAPSNAIPSRWDLASNRAILGLTLPGTRAEPPDHIHDNPMPRVGARLRKAHRRHRKNSSYRPWMGTRAPVPTCSMSAATTRRDPTRGLRGFTAQGAARPSALPGDCSVPRARRQTHIFSFPDGIAYKHYCVGFGRHQRLRPSAFSTIWLRISKPESASIRREFFRRFLMGR